MESQWVSLRLLRCSLNFRTNDVKAPYSNVLSDSWSYLLFRWDVFLLPPPVSIQAAKDSLHAKHSQY